MDVRIGYVTHFYDKIGVAIVTVEKQPLKVGDTIKISGHDQEFTQTVASMQSEHEQITQAQPGMSVGIKTDRPVRENDEVYLTS